MHMCTENLALHKPAWQSNTFAYYTGANQAVEGRYTNLSYGEDSVRRHWDKRQSGGWI